MEDISMILNTGDVPNLFAQDEKAELIEKMQSVAKQEVKSKNSCTVDTRYVTFFLALEYNSR